MLSILNPYISPPTIGGCLSPSNTTVSICLSTGEVHAHVMQITKTDAIVLKKLLFILCKNTKIILTKDEYWGKMITFVNNMEENSSFIGKSSISVFEDAVPVVSANGATSSSYIVRMHGKRMFLKHIRKEYADDERYENAFRKEFEVGFNLDHPGIVRYYEYGKDDCGSYILSEYIEGCTLTEFVVKNPEYLRVKANLDKMTNQILDALGYMHEHQILHLDIKPDNILVTSIDHDVKFIDFGFCYSDSFYGTQGHSPEYASCEQLQNLSNYDERTDIYSFGRLLSFIFASVGMKPDSRYKKLLNGCLQDDMKKRFSSAEEAAKCINRRTFGVAHYVAAVIALFGLYRFCPWIAPHKTASRISSCNGTRRKVGHELLEVRI